MVANGSTNHGFFLYFDINDKNIYILLFRNQAYWFKNHKKVIKKVVQFSKILHFKVQPSYKTM